ncbi:hypothetical protein LZQ00_14790 [Sphingobacterium sp. SRCM116780]|uniref:hypothetical protein n=1 Tax=Sphingobacterium sp. SRCM116780 TaxID=2907623 RepID=UPI001F25B3B9|nr:hypothetical protein [Sphingobacterium sp. SRCM116780]UIR55526.1 hypothetical protein LZQ00_14790 [Sphingobacterium sp. SRCM116780]
MIEKYNFPFKGTLIIMLSLILFVSCKMLKGPDFTKIQVGMTKEKVVQQLGKPDAIVASKKYQDGILEIYEYGTPQLENSADSTAGFRQYWLYFFNNELQEWGIKRNYVPSDYDRYYEKYRHRH